MQRRIFLFVENVNRIVRRDVDHQIGLGYGFVCGGHMKQRFVCDQDRVKDARAVAWVSWLVGLYSIVHFCL